MRGGTPDLFDVTISRTRRDEGMALVAGNEPDFAYEFHRYVLALPRGWTGQCEDIRQAWTGTRPKPQAWGACWNAEIRRGLLVELPDEVPMTASKSHARKTHLFRRA
jgi:hypothetical protein